MSEGKQRGTDEIGVRSIERRKRTLPGKYIRGWMTESAELSDNSFRADYGAIIGKSNLIRYTHVVESSARGGNPRYSVKFAGTALSSSSLTTSTTTPGS